MIEANASGPVESGEQSRKRAFHAGPVENLTNSALRHLPRLPDADDCRHTRFRGQVKHRIDQAAASEKPFRLAPTHARALAASKNDDPGFVHPSEPPVPSQSPDAIDAMDAIRR